MIENNFTITSITNEQIKWAARLLEFNEDTFFEKGESDPSANAIKTAETMDIVACPGSGKTTQLVAKLVILLEMWDYRFRGICVLSHTNVAKNEVKNLLRKSIRSQQLLSYPHFIGTIHSFIAEYLALPWIRSIGYPIKVISSDVCNLYRLNLIPDWCKEILKGKTKSDFLYIKMIDTTFNFLVNNKKLDAGHKLYPYIKKAIKKSTEDGYFCYEDLFIWANDLLSKNPFIIKGIRNRFPLLLVDEAQDNSEEQSKILSTIFMQGENSIIRQRFGDNNQAIYNDYSNNNEDKETDIFPNEKVISVSRSLRFNQNIADFCDPLGIIPYKMIGDGPRKKEIITQSNDCKHTIFVFNENNINKVLPSYGDLLIKTFSNDELTHGIFTAVGQVHRKDKDENIPRHIGHYWPYYDPTYIRIESNPKLFIQFVEIGRTKANEIGDYFPLVEKIAEAFLFLASSSDSFKLSNRKYKHRYILELLDKNPDFLNLYLEIVNSIIFREEDLSKELWCGKINNSIKSITEFITDNKIDRKYLDQFLSFNNDKQVSVQTDLIYDCRKNIFHYEAEGKEVNIKLGSIHSIKGETHTATLVLETFWYSHNLETLLPWLVGDNYGGENLSERAQTRMRVHYVAMSRPTHLLCLAMKEKSLHKKDQKSINKTIEKLENRGWKIEKI